MKDQGFPQTMGTAVWKPGGVRSTCSWMYQCQGQKLQTRPERDSSSLEKLSCYPTLASVHFDICCAMLCSHIRCCSKRYKCLSGEKGKENNLPQYCISPWSL